MGGTACGCQSCKNKNETPAACALCVRAGPQHNRKLYKAGMEDRCNVGGERHAEHTLSGQVGRSAGHPLGTEALLRLAPARPRVNDTANGTRGQPRPPDPSLHFLLSYYRCTLPLWEQFAREARLKANPRCRCSGRGPAVRYFMAARGIGVKSACEGGYVGRPGSVNCALRS